jgi:hypothetical protein
MLWLVSFMTVVGLQQPCIAVPVRVTPPRPNRQVHRLQSPHFWSDFPRSGITGSNHFQGTLRSRDDSSWDLQPRNTKAAHLTLTMTYRIFAYIELRTQRKLT